MDDDSPTLLAHITHWGVAHAHRAWNTWALIWDTTVLTFDATLNILSTAIWFAISRASPDNSHNQ